MRNWKKMKCNESCNGKHIPPRTRPKHKNMSSNNNNNRHASFELIEFNRTPQHNNTNNNKNIEKPKADFVSWTKSSSGKPLNQPQMNVDKQHRVDNEWFDYDAFVTWAKSPVVVHD